MNADTLRRLAAVNMPAEALREVLTIFAEIEVKNEERRARDAARKKEERDAKRAASKDRPRTIQGQSADNPGMSKECPAEVPHAPAHAREEVLTSLDSISQVSKERPPKGGPKKGFKSQVSEDVQPTEKDRAVAEREGMSPATFRLEWQKWRSHHVSEAKPVANMHQSWVKWASNWVSYGRRQADQPVRAGPSGASAGNLSTLMQKMRNQQNGEQSPSELKDITPTVSEPGAGNPGPRLPEPTRKPSGGGEILHLRPASPDARRSPAPHSEAARTFEWPNPEWERG